MLTPPHATKAFWTTLGMARVAGVGLAAAVVEGWLSRGELDRMVATCAGCDQRDACTHWLARAAPPQLPPAFCPNAAAIAALAPQAQAGCASPLAKGQPLA